MSAGYESCCVSSDPCVGEPQDCYCDVDCFLLGDCCRDIDQICTFGEREGGREGGREGDKREREREDVHYSSAYIHTYSGTP